MRIYDLRFTIYALLAMAMALPCAGQLAGPAACQHTAYNAIIPGPWWTGGFYAGNLSSTYTEYSGLARGGRVENRGYLWSIEDGATGYIIAIDKTNAALCGKWTATGATTTDVEDVASAVIGGQPYVYMADSGDNGNARATFKVIRLKEPAITRSDGTIDAGDVEQITVEYPAGNVPDHKDCETLMVDPWDGAMYFVTKRVAAPRLYRLAHASSYSGTQTLEYLGQLNTSLSAFTNLSTTQTGNNGNTTGGDISPNGREILIRSYSNVWWFARNPLNTSVSAALSNVPVSIEYVGGGEGTRSLATNTEPQGEAVCFDADGLTIFTCSESLGVRGWSATAYPLFRYGRLTKPTTTYTFQHGTNGWSGGVDTYIDSSAASTSQASAVSLVSDYDWTLFPTVISRTREGLLYFDLTTIPAHARVVSAKLDLYINTEGLGIHIYRMMSNWVASSTYNTMVSGVQLDDTDAASVADVTLLDAAAEGWDTFTGRVCFNVPTNTVQMWVANSATNKGWCITGPWESTGDGLQWDSSKTNKLERRPKLTVKVLQ